MSEYKLHPHHGLCISFFEGRGYSDNFSLNMSNQIDILDSENPEITLVFDADAICAECPHNENGRCKTYEKVYNYDRRVLDFCGLEFGDKLKWQDFHSLAKKRIIEKHLLKNVCADCRWIDICEKING